jgi:NADPH:quinone reductase-like Zn-dependent oxidoreductase
MKAIRIHSPGGPEALTLDEVPEPTPGAGQAVVKLAAAGVNYVDVYFRTGAYKAPLPLTIGLEGAGHRLRGGAGGDRRQGRGQCRVDRRGRLLRADGGHTRGPARQAAGGNGPEGRRGRPCSRASPPTTS